MFVAHCVGGLIVAQVCSFNADISSIPVTLNNWQSLAMAYQDELHHNRYDRIFSSTVGVIFMGTPFRGAHGGLSNGEILAAADEQIRMLKDEDERREAIIVKRILDILTPGNESLFNLLTNFLSIPDDLMPQLLCLYETQPANVWKIIGHSKNKVISVSFGSIHLLDYSSFL